MKPARGRAHLSVHSEVFVRAPQDRGHQKLGDGENERASEVSVVFVRVLPTGERRCTVPTLENAFSAL